MDGDAPVESFGDNFVAVAGACDVWAVGAGGFTVEVALGPLVRILMLALLMLGLLILQSRVLCLRMLQRLLRCCCCPGIIGC